MEESQVRINYNMELAQQQFCYWHCWRSFSLSNLPSFSTRRRLLLLLLLPPLSDDFSFFRSFLYSILPSFPTLFYSILPSFPTLFLPFQRPFIRFYFSDAFFALQRPFYSILPSSRGLFCLVRSLLWDLAVLSEVFVRFSCFVQFFCPILLFV